MSGDGRRPEQALRMLEVFASLGAARFDVTYTDLDGRARGFHLGRDGRALGRAMAAMLGLADARRHNVIVRPRGARVELIQLDDLDARALARVGDAAFLVLATSVGNHQAWVAVEGGADMARRLRRGTGADPGASGATRLAGSRNFKPKYAPEFPAVEIVDAAWGRVVGETELVRRGLAAAAGPRLTPAREGAGGFRSRGWPSYQRCLRGAPLARGSDEPDLSRADFTFCLLAVDWGWSVEQVCQRLLAESPKARERGESYAWLTASRAAAAVRARRSGAGTA